MHAPCLLSIVQYFRFLSHGVFSSDLVCILNIVSGSVSCIFVYVFFSYAFNRDELGKFILHTLCWRCLKCVFVFRMHMTLIVGITRDGMTSCGSVC